MGKYNLDQINHLILHKHHLSEDSKGHDVVQVIKNIYALHAQVPTTPYLSLLNRLRKFHTSDLEKALYQDKSLVKAKCMRGTVFILPKEEVISAITATQKQFIRYGDLLKQYKNLEKISEHTNQNPLPFIVSQAELDRLIKAIQDLLKDVEQGMKVEEIKRELNTQINISCLVSSLCDRGILVRGKTAKWTSARHSYVLWNNWLPAMKPEVDEKVVQKILISKYIAAFGPVTEEDVHWWTGFNKTTVRQALKEMKTETTQIEIQGLDGIFIVLNSDLANLGSVPHSNNSIHLLPRFDAYVVGYKNRQRLIDQTHQEKVFWKTRGEISASILVNGRIVGTWTYQRERKRLTITFSLFEEMNNKIVDKIYAEAQRLGEFIGDEEIRICKS